MHYVRALAAQRKEDRPMSDGSKGRPKITAGVDLGDKYSYLCLIDTQSGEVVEEGRLRTTPEAFGRRFASERPCASPSRRGRIRPGSAGCSRSAPTRSWWPTHARQGSSTLTSARPTK